MKDPTVIWAAQAAEERRRLEEADGPSPDQRAEWGNDQAGGTSAGGRTAGRFAGIVDRVRRALRR